MKGGRVYCQMKRHLTRLRHTHTLSLFLAIKIKNHEPWTAVEEEEVARIFICVLFMKKEFGNVYKDAPVGQGRFVK